MADLDELRAACYAALERRDFAAAREAIGALRPYSGAEAAELFVCAAIEAEDAEAAERALTRLAAMRPGAPYTRFLAARVAFLRGERVTVRAALEALLPKVREAAFREKILNLLGQCCRFLGDGKAATAYYLEASRAAQSPMLGALEYGNYLFNLHYLPPLSPGEAKRAAAGYDRFFSDVTPFLHRRPKPGQRLRVGYLSPDFRDHVMLRFSAALVSSRMGERFDVCAYMLGEEDAYSRALSERATLWRNLCGLSAAAAARQIYEDGIDILVDLAGHTRGGTLPILAYRPAPVQISGIGYFASTGLRTVDYFLGDIYLDDDAAQGAFTEALLVLPRTHFCYTPQGTVPSPAALSCMKKGFVTFGSFNNFSKVNDEVLRVWKRILDRVPTARLLLKADIFDREDSRDYALARVARAGIDLARVEARGVTRDYLAEYGDMDIALDTFPYPGGGTTTDALYMGVPVVTRAGNDHGGRFGRSILMNMGLSELVAETEDAYVERAVALAGDTELLAALRKNLRGMMERSPLMDAQGYREDMAAAYGMVWEAHCAKQKTPSYGEIVSLANRMRALAAGGDRRQALAAADAILAAEPEDRPLLERVAVLYHDMGEAEPTERAAALLLKRKRYGYALFLAASAASLQRRYDDAIALCREALNDRAIPPWQRGMVHHLLGNIYLVRGEREKAAEQYRLSSADKDIAHGKLSDYGNYLLDIHFAYHAPEFYLEEAKKYDSFFRDIKPYRHTSAKARHGKIRVGYISPDFQHHIVAYFSHAFFYAGDKSRFEVYGYALCPENPVSAFLAQKADAWRNLCELSAAEAAARIYGDELDILVDLSGHTGNNALPILAYRPAPVQVCGIGWFATTGLSTVDYFLVDVHTAPPGEERYFTERLIRLPESHLCFTPFDNPPEPAPAPCLATGHVTFGSLNKFDKTTDEALAAWGRILARVPKSRLFLKAAAFDDGERKTAIFARLAAAGIDTARVDTEGYTARHYVAYHRIDIALDTYPYPGGGTTCDALYMGVPVITMEGDSHHGRFGASLLRNAGLEDLCATSWASYEETAVRLAGDTERLAEIHRTLRHTLEQTAVLDEKRYMAALEAEYQRIHALPRQR